MTTNGSSGGSARPIVQSNDLLTQLGAWASEHHEQTDPYVSGLRTALDTQVNLDTWAALDPFLLLPTPHVRLGGRVRSLARLILAIRNVAVFVPVAITWLAISHATEAFGDFSKSLQPTDRAVSFLEFWQSGGPGFLEATWRIQNIAIADFAIISVLIGASLLGSALEARAETLRQQGHVAAERTRSALAISIVVTLRPTREVDPTSIAESLTAAMVDLREATRDIGQVASRLEQASSGVQALAPKVEGLSKVVDTLANTAAPAASTAIGALAGVVSQLQQSIANDATSSLANIIDGLDEVNQSLARTGASVEFGTKQLRDDLEAMHQVLASMTNRGRP